MCLDAGSRYIWLNGANGYRRAGYALLARPITCVVDIFSTASAKMRTRGDTDLIEWFMPVP